MGADDVRRIFGCLPESPTHLDCSRFIDIGGKAAANGVVGTGYFGPSKHAGALTATDVEKQIGDRLVVLDQKPEDVLKWALDVIKSEL